MATDVQTPGSRPLLIPLDQPMLVELSGSEAEKILHNLTTNQVQNLADGTAIESFITDVRGWVVAHGLVYRVDPQRWWVLGQHPSPAAVAAHIDRYIIREDAKVVDLSASTNLVLQRNHNSEVDLQARQTSMTRVAVDAFGAEAALLVFQGTLPPELVRTDATNEVWNALRISYGWPLMGQDIWEKCIPQELDRTTQAISFTKGCYLGQETIARLDALGQIQKKLTVLRCDGYSPTDPPPSPGSPILAGEQEVGKITSSTRCDGGCVSLAVIRRGHFAVGTILTCNGLSVSVVPALR